jgi:hypothetical protein
MPRLQQLEKKDEKRYFARLFISLAVIIHVIMDFHGFSMK